MAMSTHIWKKPNKILPTKVAAKLLNRKPQTLLVWSCYGLGPIQPVRINGRLGWKLSDITALIEGDNQSL